MDSVQSESYIGLSEVQRPLILAIKSHDAEKIQSLLHAGLDPNFSFNLGKTPLHMAARLPHDAALKICSVLLEYGAKPTASNVLYETPLHEAFSTRNFDLMRMFLSNGIDFRAAPATQGRYRALADASDPSELMLPDDLIKKCCDLGAGLHHFIGDGFWNGRIKAFAAHLIRSGVDPDQPSPEGTPPIVLAAQKGDNVLLGELIRRGANLRAQDRDGLGAFQYACRYQALNCVQTLMAAGIHVDDRANGYTSLAYLVDDIRTEKLSVSPLQIDMASWLIRQGASVHEPLPGNPKITALDSIKRWRTDAKKFPINTEALDDLKSLIQSKMARSAIQAIIDMPRKLRA